MGIFEIQEEDLKLTRADVIGDVSCHVFTQPNPTSHRFTSQTAQTSFTHT